MLFSKQLFNKYTLIFSTIILLQNCTSKQSAEVVDSVASLKPGPEPAVEVVKIDGSKLLNQVLLLPNGEERFAKINAKIGELEAAEGLKASDSTSNSLSFSHYFTELEDEFVDAIYFYDNNTVNSLTLDVYLYDAADVQILMSNSEKYLTDKFGKPATSSSETTWKVNNGFECILKDVSAKLAPGLKITFKKIGTEIPDE